MKVRQAWIIRRFVPARPKKSRGKLEDVLLLSRNSYAFWLELPGTPLEVAT